MSPGISHPPPYSKDELERAHKADWYNEAYHSWIERDGVPWSEYHILHQDSRHTHSWEVFCETVALQLNARLEWIMNVVRWLKVMTKDQRLMPGVSFWLEEGIANKTGWPHAIEFEFFLASIDGEFVCEVDAAECSFSFWLEEPIKRWERGHFAAKDINRYFVKNRLLWRRLRRHTK